MIMTTSLKGKLEIISREAIVLCPYLDSVRVWTWGIGHTAGAGAPRPADMPKGVASSITDILAVFSRDLAKYEERVRKAFTRQLSQAQFDAAVSFDFNTGAIDHASWVREFNAGNLGAVAADFMIWRIPASIVPRRQAECDLFMKGKYSSDGYAAVYTADASGRVLWSKGKRTYVASLLNSAMKDAPAPAPAPVAPVSNGGAAPQPAPPARVTPSPAPVSPSPTPSIPVPSPQVAKTSGVFALFALVAMAVAGWWHHVIAWVHSLF